MRFPVRCDDPKKLTRIKAAPAAPSSAIPLPRKPVQTAASAPNAKRIANVRSGEQDEWEEFYGLSSISLGVPN
jgi:hypothetical protein